jgi:hypothetical protein
MGKLTKHIEIGQHTKVLEIKGTKQEKISKNMG